MISNSTFAHWLSVMDAPDGAEVFGLERASGVAITRAPEYPE